jgi:hypothetical protein
MDGAGITMVRIPNNGEIHSAEQDHQHQRRLHFLIAALWKVGWTKGTKSFIQSQVTGFGPLDLNISTVFQNARYHVAAPLLVTHILYPKISGLESNGHSGCRCNLVAIVGSHRCQDVLLAVAVTVLPSDTVLHIPVLTQAIAGVAFMPSVVDPTAARMILWRWISAAKDESEYRCGQTDGVVFYDDSDL